MDAEQGAVFPQEVAPTLAALRREWPSIFTLATQPAIGPPLIGFIRRHDGVLERVSVGYQFSAARVSELEPERQAPWVIEAIWTTASHYLVDNGLNLEWVLREHMAQIARGAHHGSDNIEAGLHNDLGSLVDVESGVVWIDGVEIAGLAARGLDLFGLAALCGSQVLTAVVPSRFEKDFVFNFLS